MRRSYVSAACTAPAGFDSALFPFAKATDAFGTGQQLSITGQQLSMSVARTSHVAS